MDTVPEDSVTLFARTTHLPTKQKTGTEKKFHILKKDNISPQKTLDDMKKNSFCMVIQKRACL